MQPIVIDDPDDIEVILTSDCVAPPMRHGDGTTLELRNSMARFAAPDRHGERRRGVDGAIDRIDLDRTAMHAATLTLQYLDSDTDQDSDTGQGSAVDAVALARFVPVAALAAALGLVGADDDTAMVALVADVTTIAAVIGAGNPTSADADAATERLLALAGTHPDGAVAVSSLLYQALDATAAVISTELHAGSIGGSRVAAVPRTKRVVLREIEVAGRTFTTEDELTLEIGAAALEFGFGPHACPGRRVAERIAAAVVATIRSAGFHVSPESVCLDADGRPTAMRLRR